MKKAFNRSRRAATFSIVAYSSRESSWGVAVASKYLAVGAVVPYAWSNVGAIAIQSVPNLSYVETAFESLSTGVDATTTLAKLIESDPEPDDRQVGIIDKNGKAASFTGKGCSSWAGGLAGDGYTVQGNLLVSEETVSAMASAFETSDGELADRLYKALLAGDRAGGDKRGKQSAAVLVVKPKGSFGGYNDKYIDLRVDNHPQPVEELGELLRLHHIFLGSTDPEEKIKIDKRLTIEFQSLLQRLGLYDGDTNGNWDTLTQEAFFQFADLENLEERVDVRNALIDPPALDYIRERFL